MNKQTKEFFGKYQLIKDFEEQITILTTQRDGYKKELEDQNEINVKLGKALDSSQEEVKRLKEHAELDKSAIIQYQAHVKELEDALSNSQEENKEFEETFEQQQKSIKSLIDKRNLQSKQILELELRVKELTELVKEAHNFVHEKRKDTPGMGYLLTILSKGINL